jgi:beta-glucosidase
MNSIMKKSNVYLVILTLLLSSSELYSQNASILTQNDVKIDSLIAIMTLDEKLGQLTVVADGTNLTGPKGEAIDFKRAISEGKICGIQNIRGVSKLKALQDLAVKSRLGIPLIFPSDIIHGCEVVFPIPLAQACSWDIELIRKSARIIANESTALGISMNYAPMADVSRDPRWGRVMEGAGEDTYLASKVIEALVKGYQGNNLSDSNSMVACVKHFAAYGAIEAGRDYNIVDMSDRRLREIYLPTYKAAIDAGVGSVMVSFNEINGIPASCNTYLLQDILRKEWGFKGFVIGDYASVGELVKHGVASDLKEAAELALNAGVDVDLITQAYQNYGKELLDQKHLSMLTVNQSVKYVLRIKFALGLMQNPYLYLNSKREKNEVYKKEYKDVARELSQKSIVLLKNEKDLLPLNKNIKKLALIGPFIDNIRDPKGGWVFGGTHYEDVVSILSGVKSKLTNGSEILFAKGCDTKDSSKNEFENALKIAKQADVIVVGLGEPIDMIGEAASRVNLDFPGVQLELLKELHKTGKPIVVLIMSGRPLLLEWLNSNIPSIIQCWNLGHESGNAIADVLFGDYNPSGKLVISFPHSVGQIPIYYNNKTTGRPQVANEKWCSHYLDNPNTPLYPFGYGLSYTTFEYTALQLNKAKISGNDSIIASIHIKNTGKYAGEEIVQMYIRDIKGSVTRPVKELKGFQRIYLAKGEEKTIQFTLHVKDLKFYNSKMEYIAEPGEFKLFIGKSSDVVLESSFDLE